MNVIIWGHGVCEGIEDNRTPEERHLDGMAELWGCTREQALRRMVVADDCSQIIHPTRAKLQEAKA